MLLSNCSSSRELRNERVRQRPTIPGRTACKPPATPLYAINPRVLPPNPQKRTNPQPQTSVPAGFVGSKLERQSKAAPLHGKVSSFSSGKRKYGGVLPKIFKALESEDEGGIERGLALFWDDLSPKEQTVILKEQGSCERLIRVWDFFRAQEDYVPNVIHYNVVLRALGKAQRWDQLRRCWIEMAKDGVIPSNNTYGMLVDVYGKAGLVKEALLWIKHMKMRGVFPDEVTMNTIIRVLKDSGEFDRADKFYKNWCDGRVEFDELELDAMVDSIDGYGASPISYKQFLSTELFKTGGRMRELGTIDEEFSSRKPQLTSTFNTLIDLYGKAGRLQDAADVFGEMLRSGVAIDVITFNTMIFTCGSHGLLSEAEALLDEMEKRGISPDTKTYNIFMSLYADAGKIEAALDCYRKIRKVGLFPDVVTHRAIIHKLCEKNMVDGVVGIVEEMQNYGIQIDEHSLPAIVKIYMDQGMINDAKVLITGVVKDYSLSSRIRVALMDIFADKGLWAEAENIFVMKSDSIGQKKDVQEYNVMIKAYGKARLYEKAVSLHKNMKNQGTWPDECTYNSLIQMLAGGELPEEARGFLNEMQKVGYRPQCRTFSAVIACYARLGQLADAIDVLNEMEKAGVKANEVVYGSLINGFAEIGKAEEALQYFQWMEECHIPANKVVLTSLIKAYSKLGCIEGAKSIYQRMMHMEDGVDVVASNSMINLYADLGMISEAKLIFDGLIEKNLADSVSFATMMFLYKSMGMLDEAIEVAEEMKQAGLLKDCASYNKVMACYATNGQLLECAELLYEMISRKLLPDKGTFKVLYTLLKKGGLPIEAVNQLESSYQEGRPYARQAIISSVYAMVGLSDFARESCEVLLRAEVPLDSFIYNVCIYVDFTLGEVDRALNTYMKMQDDGVGPDLVTYINLVNCYGKAGIVEGVRRIHSQLKFKEIELCESLFRAVSEAYRAANRHELAELVTKEMNLFLDAEQYSESEAETDYSDNYWALVSYLCSYASSIIFKPRGRSLTYSASDIFGASQGCRDKMQGRREPAILCSHS
ncbi:hypothetical protein MLD38_033365 [Melastoma candidum]|uniref:Uncharacterized protein n=1 Tax=Melastoma candidum TaxID=119954 RepID=A0ACB9M8B8_9MYRT|nr:hypothetical protein MLD38_033365 [Melastoma candidum]